MAIRDEVLKEFLEGYKKPEDLLGPERLLKKLTAALVEFSAAQPGACGALPVPTPTPTVPATPTGTPPPGDTATPTVPPTPGPGGGVTVPTLSPWSLALFGLVLAGAAMLLVRRG